MNKKASWVRLFLGGFLLMALVQLTLRCEDYAGLPEYNVTDSKDADKVADLIEEAFLSGDPEEIINLMTPSSVAVYTELIQGSTSESLKAFGEAFKSRTLGVISEKYAEYKFTVGGKSYSIALSLSDEDGWQIMRL
jgi:hypothetical protein